MLMGELQCVSQGRTTDRNCWIYPGDRSGFQFLMGECLGNCISASPRGAMVNDSRVRHCSPNGIGRWFWTSLYQARQSYRDRRDKIYSMLDPEWSWADVQPGCAVVIAATNCSDRNLASRPEPLD